MEVNGVLRRLVEDEEGEKVVEQSKSLRLL